MVRNSGKGGSGHKKLKNSIDSINAELVFREHGQEYAIVKEMLGGGRCIAKCFSDGVERICIIRGSMRSKRNCFIRKNNMVLLSLREFQDTKADIIHLYSDDDIRMLISYEEITHDFVISSSTFSYEEQTDNENVLFEDI
tara:strand:+ start:1243 stop:1662 length:420 start_codon:yes stop_codon:yes gene_type:complete